MSQWSGHMPSEGSPRVATDPSTVAARAASVRSGLGLTESSVPGAGRAGLPDPALLARSSQAELSQALLDPLEVAALRLGLDTADVAEMWAELSGEAYSADALDAAEPDLPASSFAFQALRDAQRTSQQADVSRVLAALAAYRASMREVAGTPDAASNGMYERAVVHQIAIEVRVADRTALTLVHTADALERRFPSSWAVFVAGEVPWRGMQMIHAQADGLDTERIGEYDEQAAEAVGSTPLPRLKERLHRIRERLQADTAVPRHRAAMLTRSVILDPASDGMATLTIHGDAAEMIGLDHQLGQAAIHLAGLEGEHRTVTQLRYDVLMDILVEGAACDADRADDRLSAPLRRGVQPVVSVLVPATTLLGKSGVPATLNGYGPIDSETARRLAGTAKTWIRILTHPVDGTVVDIDRTRYRPPEDLRRLVVTLDGTCRCGCGRRTGDLDHVREWVIHRGRTALDNLILLARRCHRLKTSGPYAVELLPDRSVVWTSIWGTRTVVRPETDLEPTPVPDEYLAAQPDAPDAPDAPDEPDDAPF